MTRSRQLTRDDVLAGYCERMIRETGASMESFSQRVVEAYHELVPEGRRSIKFKRGGDVFDDAKVNAKHLGRWIDRTTTARLPAEIEEAWVEGLTEPYRSECKRDLAARYGLLAAAIPTALPADDLASMGEFTIEFGEALRKLAPIFADGKIDRDDVSLAPEAIRAVEDVMSKATSLAARLRALIGDAR